MMWHKKAAGKELPERGYFRGEGGLRPERMISPIRSLASLGSRMGSESLHLAERDRKITASKTSLPSYTPIP